MSYKVVVTAYIPGKETVTEVAKEVMGQIDAEVVNIPAQTEVSVVDAARNADAVLVAIEPYTRSVMKELVNCKVISTIGVGYDSVDVAAATDFGIIVVNNWDYCLDEVSDHAVTLILACARKIVTFNTAVKSGKWVEPGISKMHKEILPGIFRLRNQTLGLVGFGGIARKVAQKIEHFGLKIIAHDPYIPHDIADKLNVELVDFETLIKESDYISVHAALTDENKYMFGKEQFSKMKPTSYLVNTARGGLIDEKALYVAISQGLLAGAALDPMENEPVLPDNPLLKLDNVILTAHSAYYSAESDREMFRKPPQKILQVLTGQWPEKILNPQVKDNFIKRWGKQ